MAKVNKNTTKDLLNKEVEMDEISHKIVLNKYVVSGVKENKKVYKFVSDNDYFYIPDPKKRNRGYQFIKGVYETTDIGIAKYIYCFSGVICIEGKEDLVEQYY